MSERDNDLQSVRRPGAALLRVMDADGTASNPFTRLAQATD